ncbi:hypothetical protein D9M70_271160 [compost metagenome]
MVHGHAEAFALVDLDVFHHLAFASGIDADIPTGLQVDVVGRLQIGANLVDIPTGGQVQVLAGTDLAGSGRLLGKAVLFLLALATDKYAHPVVVGGETKARPLVLFPVTLATGGLRRQDVDIPASVEAHVAPGTDAATKHIDVTLGLQGRIAIGTDLAADTGAALRFLPGLLGRSHRNETVGDGHPDLLLVFLGQAVRRVIGRHQVDVAILVNKTRAQFDVVARSRRTGP